MAQDIQRAFKDLEQTLKQLKWLSVSTEAGRAGGGKGYSVEITQGSQEPDSNAFGASDINYGYILTLKISKSVNQGLISDNKRAIHRQIEADRRRGQNAQTTITTPWVTEEDDGRENMVFTSEITIRIKELKNG